MGLGERLACPAAQRAGGAQVTHDLEILEVMDGVFPLCVVVQRTGERKVLYAPHTVRTARLVAWCTDVDDALAYIAEREATRAGRT
jgi:hypothetical protein